MKRVAPEPMETAAADDPNVVYFGPGIHRRDITELKAGETLYLDGGAILEGALRAKGDGITIKGRGILSGAPWEWLHGPSAGKKEWGDDHPTWTLTDISGNGVTIKDTTFFSPWCWRFPRRPGRHRDCSRGHPRTIRTGDGNGSRIRSGTGISAGTSSAAASTRRR